MGSSSDGWCFGDFCEEWDERVFWEECFVFGHDAYFCGDDGRDFFGVAYGVDAVYFVVFEKFCECEDGAEFLDASGVFASCFFEFGFADKGVEGAHVLNVHVFGCAPAEVFFDVFWFADENEIAVGYESRGVFGCFGGAFAGCLAVKNVSALGVYAEPFGDMFKRGLCVGHFAWK